MCGRYALVTSSEDLAAEFELVEYVESIKKRFNIAPTQSAPVVRVGGAARHRESAMLRWGLIPSWAKDAKMAARMINARSETASSSPAFRSAFKSRRCLVPCSGFYEWQLISGGSKPKKQPYWIRAPGRRLLALAGLWEPWRSPDHEELHTFTILTTEPNSFMERLHNRMPVILNPEDFDAWLDPDEQDAVRLSRLLRPCSPELLAADPVSDRVNSPRFDDPSCMEPITRSA